MICVMIVAWITYGIVVASSLSTTKTMGIGEFFANWTGL